MPLSELEVDTRPREQSLCGGETMATCSVFGLRMPAQDPSPSRKKRYMLCEPSDISMISIR